MKSLTRRARVLVGGLAQPARLLYEAISPRGRASLNLLEQLRDSQRGETGVIVCNGPSLLTTDLELVGNHPYILLNRGYLLADRFTHPPVALCVHDPLVIANFAGDFSSFAGLVVTTVNAQRQLRRDAGTVHLVIARRWKFATGLGLNLHHGGTVTFWALNLAYLLGWQKAVVVGMDHSYGRLSSEGQFAVANGNENDHFTPNYFPPGTRHLVGDMAVNEYSYALAREAWLADGREIVDCTPGGLCDVFRKSALATELS